MGVPNFGLLTYALEQMAPLAPQRLGVKNPRQFQFAFVGKNRTLKIRFAEVRATEVRVAEVRAAEVRALKICAAQVGAVEVSAPKICAVVFRGKVRPAQDALRRRRGEEAVARPSPANAPKPRSCRSHRCPE